MEHEHRVNHDRERPRSLEVNVATIPEELQQYPSWVVWQYRMVDGEWKKPPITPASGWLASVANSKTWGSFEEAKHAYETGRYAGMGFVLTKEAGIVGMDIDHCIHNHNLTHQAEEMITTLQTHTEISPSGEGVHLMLKGYLPGVYHRQGNVELYEDKRYLTITGHAIHTPPTIPNRQAELETIYTDLFRTFVTPLNTPESTGRVGKPAQRRNPHLTDETTLKKAYNAHNGATFARYYEGDHSLWENGKHRSQSEADYQLCLYLLYWTNGDAMQADRLFRHSGLMRNKWDRPLRRDLTYGQFTLANAREKGRR